MKTFSKNTTFIFLASAISAMLLLNPLYLIAQEDAGQNKYGLEISFSKEDTTNKVKVVIYSVDTLKDKKPVKDVEVKFYAKKSFGLLPLGDVQTTDDNGEATIDFPADLPGDSLGNVQVIAKVEDNDELGNLEGMKTVRWGIPKYVDPLFHKRALWGSAANAPLPLVITVTSMVILVWGVIFYIIILLFKIPKS